jgi:hypothetical protein
LTHEPLVHVGVLPEHAVHAAPLLPHAPLSVPATHVVLLQQPPLHSRLPAHDVPHW